MTQRDTALDIIRIVACLMVVMMHSPLPTGAANGPFRVALSYTTEPCIGLFFMVSGALLLPVTRSYTSFLKRRLGKVICPTIFWTAIYVAMKLYYHPEDVNLCRIIFSIPFSAQGHGVLWFMYTLTGLYLIAPILSAWLEKATKKDLQIVLGIWAVTLCYPILSLWIEINDSCSGILYYFGGYAGYFVLGYYMRKYSNAVSIIASGVIAMGGAIILLAMKKFGVEVDFATMFGYLSIFVCALTIFVWKILSCLHKILVISRLRIGGVSSLLANLSFGVYLVHIVVMRYWVWKQNWISDINNDIIQTFIIATITIILSFVISYLISLTPFGNYLIGYKDRK